MSLLFLLRHCWCNMDELKPVVVMHSTGPYWQKHIFGDLLSSKHLEHCSPSPAIASRISASISCISAMPCIGASSSAGRDWLVPVTEAEFARVADEAHDFAFGSTFHEGSLMAVSSNGSSTGEEVQAFEPIVASEPTVADPQLLTFCPCPVCKGIRNETFGTAPSLSMQGVASSSGYVEPRVTEEELAYQQEQLGDYERKWDLVIDAWERFKGKTPWWECSDPDVKLYRKSKRKKAVRQSSAGYEGWLEVALSEQTVLASSMAPNPTEVRDDQEGAATHVAADPSG